MAPPSSSFALRECTLIIQQTEAPTNNGNDCRFVEVLTAQISGNTIGYRFGGSLAGPNALVAGEAALVDALFDRLHRLPTLPWKWGKLYIVVLDGVECLDLDSVRICLADVQLDELIMLPHTKGSPVWQHSVDPAYWTTLRLFQRLGMMEGRGIRMDAV